MSSNLLQMTFEQALKHKLKINDPNSSELILVCPHSILDPFGFTSFIHDARKEKFDDLDAKRFSTKNVFSVLKINKVHLSQYN